MTGRIVVLGMHRSGTSCVGELLTAMGAYFGPPEMGSVGSVENPHGLFERRDLRRLCRFVLRQARAEWWATSGFSPDRVPRAAWTQIESWLGAMLADLDAHQPWFIKDPRLCILLPMLRSRLGEIVAVQVWRHPLEVAESLWTRDAFAPEFGAALWERHVRAAFAAGVSSAVISYNRLVADPEGSARRLLEDLAALGVTGLQMPDARELARAVDPAFHRSRPRQDLADLLTPSQRRLLAALETGSPDDPELATPLSAVQIARLASLERARRRQIKAAAYRALAEARALQPRPSLGERLRQAMDALRYLPLRPAKWIRWWRQGSLGRRLRQRCHAVSIAVAGGFDGAWYAQHYPDLAARGDPLMHFVRHGAREGRDPAPCSPTSRHLRAALQERTG